MKIKWDAINKNSVYLSGVGIYCQSEKVEENEEEIKRVSSPKPEDFPPTLAPPDNQVSLFLLSPPVNGPQATHASLGQEATEPFVPPKALPWGFWPCRVRDVLGLFTRASCRVTHPQGALSALKWKLMGAWAMSPAISC